MANKKTTKKAAKKAAKKPADKPATPAPVSAPPHPTLEPEPAKDPAPKKPKFSPATNEELEEMATIFESAVHALGEPQDNWTDLAKKHVETNNRYAEICRRLKK